MAVQISAQDYYNKFGEAPSRATASGAKVQIPVKISLADFENKFGKSTLNPPMPEPTWTEKIGSFISNTISHPRETVNKVGEFVGGGFIAQQNLKKLQPEANARIKNEIEQNNILLDTWEKKKRENPGKTDFYNQQIDNLNKRNQEISSEIGQTWDDLNTKQKFGYNLAVAVDIAGILAPLQGLLKNAGKLAVKTAIKRYGTETFGAIFSEGTRVVGKQGVEEMLKKGGGKLSAEATDTIIHQGMESLGKTGLLKGDKLISKAGITNIATNPFVVEGAAYGGAQGLAGGMQQNHGVLGTAESTATGAVFGAGAGVGLYGAGKIITAATRGVIGSVSNKIAGKEAVTEARATIKATEELLGHKLGNTEKKQITKSVFNGATKDDVIKSIINEADNAKVDLDTDKIVRATDNYFDNVDTNSADIFDVPETAMVSSKIVSAKTSDEVEKLIPDFVPESERSGLANRLNAINNPDEVASILDGYNPVTITEKLATQISKTENQKSIEKMLVGVVPEKEIPSAAKDLSKMKNPSQIVQVLDGYKTKSAPEPAISTKYHSTKEGGEKLPEPKIQQKTSEKTAETPNTNIQEPKAKSYPGSGDDMERGASRSIREKAIASGMDSFDIPAYKQLETKKIFQTKVPDFVDNTPINEVMDVAMGRTPAPDGIPPELVLIDLAKKADVSGDYALLERLANESSLIEEATTMGQRIQAWSLLNEFSPAKILIDIKKAYIKEGGENARREIMKKTEIMKKELDFKVEDARGILASLLCKT